MISMNPSNWFSKSKKDDYEDSTDWLNRVINELANPMPSYLNDNKYAPPERRAELDTEMMLIEQNPKPEEEEANWFIDEEDGQEYEGPNTHEKMYKIATSKYNPFAVGGSENIHDFDEKCS